MNYSPGARRSPKVSQEKLPHKLWLTVHNLKYPRPSRAFCCYKIFSQLVGWHQPPRSQVCPRQCSISWMEQEPRAWPLWCTHVNFTRLMQSLIWPFVGRFKVEKMVPFCRLLVRLHTGILVAIPPALVQSHTTQYFHICLSCLSSCCPPLEARSVFASEWVCVWVFKEDIWVPSCLSLHRDLQTEFLMIFTDRCYGDFSSQLGTSWLKSLVGLELLPFQGASLPLRCPFLVFNNPFSITAPPTTSFNRASFLNP